MSEIKFKLFISKINYGEVSLKILSFIVLAFFTFLIVSYSSGNISLPFFTKEDKAEEKTNSEESVAVKEETLPPETEISEEPINLSHITNPDTLTETASAQREESAIPFPMITEEMKNAGYVLSQNDYQKGSVEFYRIDLTENPYMPVSLNVFVEEEQKYAVEVEMGYIFVHRDDGNSEMLDNFAQKIIGNLKYRSLQLIYQRDRRGLPVFWNGSGYRVYDTEQKVFVESDYNEIINDRGLSFSYPKYFGYPVNSKLTRFYNEKTKKWGYKNAETEEIVIKATYDEAYNFNNGYAVAIKYEYRDKKRMYFLDETGKVLNKDYFAPDSLGKSKTGFLYFENGLTRALSRKYNWNSVILDEIPYLCYPDGRQFQLPPDYTLKAYSDGVIMLEKAGKYGFMDSNGNWIAQPIYSYASPFSEGVAVVGLSDTKKALIDTEGNLLTGFSYEHITDCAGGVIAFFENSQGWIIVNKMELKESR